MSVNVNFDHILNHKDELRTLCQPLNKLNIPFFHFIRRFNDNSRIHLCTHPEWIEHFYNQKFFQLGSMEGSNILYHSDIYLWSSFKNQIIFNNLRETNQIDHGITFIKKYKNNMDFYHFGASLENSNAINFYLSNLDLLNRFILYFQEQAVGLIKHLETQKIVVPFRKINPFDNDLVRIMQISKSQFESLRKSFIDETKIKHYYLRTVFDRVVFSDRELDCIVGLLESKSATEIGEKLFISKRTVETHLENIKIKLQCNKKSELIQKLLAKGLCFNEWIMRIFD